VASSRPKTAAIIPAYNEASTVGDVVRVVASSSLVDEVLVISDGSTDDTAAQARAAGAHLVHELPRRGGKGSAMLHGVTHTDAPMVVFFDADLKGLTSDHVERLLLPVLSGARSMNIGLRDRGPWLTRLSRHLPLISGERALKREVFERIPPEFLQGFMVEAAMNYACRSRGLRYGAVVMPGLTIRHKYEKVGVKKACGEYLWMFAEVCKAMFVVRIAHLFKQF
jgi:glycosyltransferase involved in cell wall biosynthesis